MNRESTFSCIFLFQEPQLVLTGNMGKNLAKTPSPLLVGEGEQQPLPKHHPHTFPLSSPPNEALIYKGKLVKIVPLETNCS